MTLFEYLAIAFGLLFSITSLRLIGGLPAALDPDRRYWVHLTLVISMLISSAAAFWTFWSLREVDWTFPRFALALGMPAIMYFNAATLVPADPRHVAHWRAYYFDVRRRFFGGIASWAFVAAAAATVNLQMPLLSHPARVVHLLVATIGVSGLFSSNPRVHATLACGFAVIVVLIALTAGAEPGWLVS